MIRSVLKWSGIAVVLIATSVVGLLLAHGVPKPPNLTADDVGRVAWAPFLRSVAKIDRAKSKSMEAWMPDGSGMLVWSAHLLLDSRLHHVSAPGEEPVFLPNLPRNLSGIATDQGRPYAIVSWDVAGNELNQLHRWDLRNAVPVPITPPGERSHFGAFEPEGRRVAYLSNRRNGTDFDLYLMDPQNPGSDQRVMELRGSWSVSDWSTEAPELLLSNQHSNTQNELHILNLETLELRRLSDPARGGAYRFAQWSHDGRALYYASDHDTEFAHLRRLDLETGEEATLSDEIPWDVQSIQESHDGELLLVGFNEDGYDRYYTTDPLGHNFESLRGPSPGLMAAKLHPRERTVFINHTDPRGRQRVYTHELDQGGFDLWAGTEPVADDAPGTRSIRYPTFDTVDGQTRRIPAVVYPGKGPGPHPVLISIHGGPEAQARPMTRWRSAQTKGITVITPNVRGSTGYGRSFERLDNGMLREDAVRDIGALLDWIREQPDLDATRVAVVGGSYGGYMVLASLVHYSDRLRCGIDRVGVSNFVTFLENTADWRRDLRRAEYGDERDPAMRDFLEEISPLNHAERITSRLMVVQGANDPRVPVTESRQLVERVGANGKPVAYLEAADEGHGFRKPWNSYYANAAEQQMLAECLHRR